MHKVSTPSVGSTLSIDQRVFVTKPVDNTHQMVTDLNVYYVTLFLGLACIYDVGLVK